MPEVAEVLSPLWGYVREVAGGLVADVANFHAERLARLIPSIVS